MGMYVAMNFIQNRLDPMDTADRAVLPVEAFEAVRDADLQVLVKPYLAIGVVVVVMMALIAVVRMPDNGDRHKRDALLPTVKRIFSVAKYREGVIAQFFYVGVQIMCWTFIIQYGTRIFMEQGMAEKDAEILSQRYNIVAMLVFCVSRFICTFLLRYLRPGVLLRSLAIAAGVLTIGVIFFQNILGLYCLVGISACMSLMFPTIYGIALEGMGDDAKFGAAGLIMAILGGSVLPPVQAAIIDCGTIFGFPSVNISFVVPLICFIVVALYGFRQSHITAKKK